MNNHKKAIEILAREEIDYKEIAIQVAIHNPAIFLKYHKSKIVEPSYLKILRSGMYIGAIKEYRSETGTGLKEAKDAIDELCTKHNIKRKIEF